MRNFGCVISWCPMISHSVYQVHVVYWEYFTKALNFLWQMYLLQSPNVLGYYSPVNLVSESIYIIFQHSYYYTRTKCFASVRGSKGKVACITAWICYRTNACSIRALWKIIMWTITFPLGV